MKHRRLAVIAAVAAGVTLACGALLDLPNPALDPNIGDAAAVTDASQADAAAATDSAVAQDASADAAPAIVAIVPDTKAWGIALDATHVFWSEPFSPRIGRADKTGANVTTLASGTATFGTQDLATDGADIFWCSVDSVYRCSLAGCSNAPTKIGTLPNSGVYVALDATNVFVTTAASNSLWSVPKVGGDPVLVATFAAKPIAPLVVGADLVVSFEDGSIVKLPKSGGAVTELVKAGGKPAYGMTPVGGRVYFTEFGNPANVAFTDLSAGGSNPVALNQAVPFGITSDGADLFWVTQGSLNVDGTVERCSLAQCTPTLIAPLRDAPKRIVTDAVAAYWTEAGNIGKGGVYKIAK